MVEPDGATRSALMRISSPDVKSRRHKPARPGKELSLSSSIPDRCSQSAVSFDFPDHLEDPVVQRDRDSVLLRLHGDGYVLGFALPFPVDDVPMDAAGLLH